MRLLIRKGKRDPRLRAEAIGVVAQVAPKDFAGEVRALYHHVLATCRYVQDPHEVEQLQPAHFTQDIRTGDCDDLVIYLSSLLESIGHATKSVAVGFAPHDYSHVYLETLIGRSWIPVDPTEDRGVGWSPPDVLQRMEIFNGG